MIEEQLRVLLVDDEESLRGPLKRYLEISFGYHVDAVASGEVALQRIVEAKRTYDVALIDDLLIPERGAEPEPIGIDLMKQIRKHCPETECIVFTGWGMDRAMGALRAGAYRYLAKPLNLDELGMTIRMAAEQAWLRQERDLLSAALEISNTMVSAADATRVLEVITEAIPRLTGADACAMALIDPVTGRVQHEPAVWLGDTSVVWKRHLRQEALTRQISEIGKPFIVARVDDRVDELDENLVKSGVRSFVGIPIPAGTRNLGALYAYSLLSEAFGHYEEQVLTLLARQAGIALENAQLVHSTRRASKQLSALNQVVLEVGKELDWQALLRKVIDQAMKLLAAEGGGVYLLDPTGEYLILEMAAGLSLDLEGQRIGRNEGLTGEILRTAKPQKAADYYRWGKRLRILDAHKLTAVAGAPIRVGERILGTLIVHDTRPERQFDDTALRLLQQFANHAGLALQKAALLEKLRAIQEVSTTITSSLEFQEVLNRICQAAVELFGIDHSGLVLFEKDLEWGIVEGEYPAQPNTLGTQIPIEGVPAEERLAFDGETLVFPNVEEAASELGPVLDIWRRLDIRSILVVPIIYQNRILGSFSLDAVGRIRQFTEEEIELCKVFAAGVAVAVENARLFSQLSETEERLDGLIASSLDAVIAIDQDKNITVFNRRAEEMFGWTAEEMIGQSVARLHVDFSRAQDIHQVLDREGTLANWEIVLKHKDGTRIPALLSATLIRDSQGNPIGQAGFLRDLRQVNLLEERLRALIRVSQTLTVTLELDKVLDLIVESAVAAFPTAQSGAIHLYDERTDTLRVRAITRDYSAEAIEALSLRVGEGIAGWVFQNQRPLVVDDAGQDPRYKRIDYPEVQDHRSMVCVPLWVKEQVIGVLSLSNSDVTSVFQADDLGLLSTFASQAVAVIVNAELMTKNRERLRKLEMLSQASNEMMSNLHSLSFSDRLNLIVRRAAQILDAEACSILLVRRPGFLIKEACYGHLESDFQKGREFAIKSGRKTGLTGYIAYTGQLFNAHGDDLVGHWAVAGKEPAHVASGKCHSLLAIPLKRRLDSGEQLIGLLEVENKKDKDGQPKSDIGFTEEDEWILTIFAETVVICLENAELYERTSDRLEEKVVSLKAIQETGAAISAELDLDELLELVTEKAAKVFVAPAASLMLWDNAEENLVVRAKYGLADEYTQQRVTKERVDAVIAQMGRVRPLATVDLRSTPYGRLDLIETEHLCSVLSAPLVISGRLIGILNIYSKEEPRQFTSDEIEVAEVFASQAAIAIRNARLYEAIKRQSQHWQALHEASKAITAGFTSERKQVLSRIVEQAVERITGTKGPKAVWSAILLYDEATNELQFESVYPLKASLELEARLGNRWPLDVDKAPGGRIGITGRTVLEGKPQRVEDVRADPDYLEAKVTTRSELDVPLLDGDRVIGVLSVESDQVEAFDEDDEQALQGLAELAVIAIKNAERAEQLARSEMVALMGAWGAEVTHDVNREVGAIRRAIWRLQRSSELSPHFKTRLQEIDHYAEDLALPELPKQPPVPGHGLRFRDACPLDMVIAAEVNHLRDIYSTVSFRKDLNCNGIWVAMHRQWLRRLLRHLIRNAVNAISPEEEERIVTVRTRAQDSMVSVQVEDKGKGVRPEIIPLLFKRPIPHEDDRQGCGLLVVRFVVEQHGGQAGLVRTQPGQGACFAFSIPIVEREQGAQAAE